MPRSEPEPRYTVAEVLERLTASPGRLAAATGTATVDVLHDPLEVGGWSARDILGHIRACDMTWGGYMERILGEDQPSFRAESPRTTIHRTDFLEQPFAASLRAFTDDRARLMGRLRGAGEAAFARTAIVTIPGLGKQPRSVLYYADRLAVHEQEHIRHIERAMAARM